MHFIKKREDFQSYIEISTKNGILKHNYTNKCFENFHEKGSEGFVIWENESGKKEIEALFHEVQINLENNYKDLAISARKQAEVKLAEYQAAGELKEKEYKKLKEQLDEYTKRMEGYHH